MPFYYRFVDDIVTAVPKNKVDLILNVFNSFNESIQFTVEKEKDRKIAFLDLWIIRSEAGAIKTDWHHKDTWSGRYLNFESNLPFSYKRNTIKILTDKITQLSDPEFHKKNIELMTNTGKHWKKRIPEEFHQTNRRENTGKDRK